jgi:hypothetical protein
MGSWKGVEDLLNDVREAGQNGGDKTEEDETEQ